MADAYGESTPLSPDAPAIGAKAINYASDQDLSDRRVRGIYISVAGTLKVDFVDQKTSSIGVTLAGLSAGQIYPFCITKIYTTGSSVAAGVVLY